MSDETFYCSCGEDFDERQTLEAHKKNCPTFKEIEVQDSKPKLVPNLRHVCKFCGKNFQSPSKLERHQYVHTGEKPFSCGICSKGFIQLIHLENHMKSTHPSVETTQATNSLKCTKCSKEFDNARSLYNHNRYVHPKYLYKCSTCGVSLKTTNSLKVHAKVAHGTELPTFKKIKENEFEENEPKSKETIKTGDPNKCDKCGKGFDSAKLLRDHIYNVHPKRMLECKICGKAVKIKSSLRRHMERVHNSVKELIQDSDPVNPPTQIQSSKEPEKSEENEPKSNELTQAEEEFKCDKCGKVFNNAKSLFNHDYHVHPKEKFECETCGKVLKSKGTLKRHKIDVHQKSKIRQIEKSPQIKKESKPKINRSLQTYKKPVQSNNCSHCDRKFDKVSDLKEHQMVFHKGFRYQCDQCKQEFMSHGACYEHKKQSHPTMPEQQQLSFKLVSCAIEQ